MVKTTEETQFHEEKDGDTNNKGDDKKSGMASYPLSDGTDG